MLPNFIGIGAPKSGTFLIDSESQLKAAASGMGAAKDHQGAAPDTPAAPPHGGHARD